MTLSMKKVYIITLIIVIFNSFLSCTQVKFNKLNKETFSINYPSYFELDESGESGTSFILTSTKESNRENDFVENINLIIADVGNLTFNEIADKSVNEVKSIATILENKKFKQNGNDCLRLVFKAVQGKYHLTVTQHLLVKKGKVYVLTFTSDSEDYQDYLKDVDSSISSFKLE